MKKIPVITFILFLSINLINSQELSNINSHILKSIDKHSSNLIKISDQIWELAETAFNEHESSQILADYAKKNGFDIEMGVAEMPTAFVATYGKGNQ